MICLYMYRCVTVKVYTVTLTSKVIAFTVPHYRWLKVPECMHFKPTFCVRYHTPARMRMYVRIWCIDDSICVAIELAEGQ